MKNGTSEWKIFPLAKTTNDTTRKKLKFNQTGELKTKISSPILNKRVDIALKFRYINHERERLYNEK